ncbi:MAG: hypothetical protein QNK92_14290 [Amylibacter sp.]
MGKRHFLMIFLAVLGVLIVPAQLLNFQMERKVQALVEGDRDELVLPLKFEAVTLRTKSVWNSSGSLCGGFCLHALLTGTAKKVLKTNTKNFTKPIDFDEEVIEISLQRRDTCPAITFSPGQHRLDIPLDRTSGKRAANAIEDMKLGMNSGEVGFKACDFGRGGCGVDPCAFDSGSAFYVTAWVFFDHEYRDR